MDHGSRPRGLEINTSHEGTTTVPAIPRLRPVTATDNWRGRRSQHDCVPCHACRCPTTTTSRARCWRTIGSDPIPRAQLFPGPELTFCVLSLLLAPLRFVRASRSVMREGPRSTITIPGSVYHGPCPSVPRAREGLLWLAVGSCLKHTLSSAAPVSEELCCTGRTLLSPQRWLRRLQTLRCPNAHRRRPTPSHCRPRLRSDPQTRPS